MAKIRTLRNAFKKSVKPFFYPAKSCFIYRSSNSKLSEEIDQYYKFYPKQIKKEMGFKFLCNDLEKSVRQAEKFRDEQNMIVNFPKILKEQGVNRYGIEWNYLDFLILHKISPKIGFAISTYSPLKMGSIIAEYVGERKYFAVDKVYDTSYAFILNTAEMIDAKDYGNVARFFHHCPTAHSNEKVLTANMKVVSWKASEDLTKIFFITTRDIKKFEPLCWDYGNEFTFEHDVELLHAETYMPISTGHDEL